MLLYSTDVADASTNGRPRTDEGTTIYRPDFYVYNHILEQKNCYAILKIEVRKRSA